MSAPTDPASYAISFDLLAEIAVGVTARIDLCRVTGGRADLVGQLVAVKRLHPHIAEEPEFKNQFLDEVWMTASLKHPNVVEVAGWGADDKGAYLAVELVQGVALSRLMKTILDTGEEFGERMVVYLGSRICRGLAAAHALHAPSGEFLNLVHRDLTPSNILMGFNGDVKIADFGLAKAKLRLTRTLTGMRKGEPTYMAPEQAQGDEVDARTDLFSLGVLLFELFAGRRPWVGATDVEIIQKMWSEPPTSLRELRPKIDRELVNVVNRCLERDPAARFRSASEIADRFEHWLLVHGYNEGNEESLARFVRRNAMRQMRWFERAVAGDFVKGRRQAPRVPTYTEHTNLPIEVRDRSPAPIQPGDPRARATVIEGPPTVLDDRGPTRGRGRREVTQVEGQIAERQAQAGPPIIVPKAESEDWSGEEAPTLIQQGNRELEAMRAKHAKRPGGPPPPPPRGAAIIDDESDQKVTSIRSDRPQRGAPRVSGPVIFDADSQAPTTKAHSADAPPFEAERADAPKRAKSEPVHDVDTENPTERLTRPPSLMVSKQAARAPGPSGSRPSTSPGVREAPAAPPFAQPSPRAAAAEAIVDVPTSPISMVVPAPSPAAQPSPPIAAPPAGHAMPPSAMPPPLVGASPISIPPPPLAPAPPEWLAGRSPAHEAASEGLTEDALIAEADRMAIEAVRRGEDAKISALRAERKASLAKQAADAARLAADAVRLLTSGDRAGAAQRLEEARRLEQAVLRGHQELSGGSAARRPSVFPEAAEAPRSSHSPESGVRTSALVDPALRANLAAEAAANAALRSAPGLAPLPPIPSMPPPGSTLATTDAEAFRARLSPRLLGVPLPAVAALAVAFVLAIVVILWQVLG